MSFIKERITSKWFFSRPNIIFRILQIYINGDALVIIPILLIILGLTLFSLKLSLLMFAFYIVFRALGEMIYWLLQQFGKREYRPSDFGLKNLDNNAIYIIYQLLALVNLLIGTGIVVYITLFYK